MHKVVIKVLKVLRKKHENELCLFERDTDPEDVLSPQSYRITWAFHSYVLTGPEQSMKPMIGKSIDQSITIDYLLVNWHRDASANR